MRSLRRNLEVSPRQLIGGLCAAALLGALVLPQVLPEPASAAINYPTIFGQLTGDCTTPGANSYATTCTKLNGVAPGTAFSQSIGTSGANIPLLNGTNTWSGTQSFAAISLTGAFNGAADTFTGLSTQTGGHIVGVGDYTAAQTLTAGTEDTTFTCTASCAVTLPVCAAASNGLQLVVQDLSATAGYPVITPASTATKVMTPSGQAATYTYQGLYQGAKWTCHSALNLWVAE